MRRQCSREYKTDVVEQVIRRELLGLKPRQRAPKDVVVHQFTGISWDERGRAERMEANPERQRPWRINHFPLIERNMTRGDCLTWLHEVGKVPYRVPKSSCTFCPFHSDTDWQLVKANPKDWARAVEVDRALREPGRVVNRNLDQKLYVHRSCVPLEQVKLKPYTEREMQLGLGFVSECEGGCGV